MLGPQAASERCSLSFWRLRYVALCFCQGVAEVVAAGAVPVEEAEGGGSSGTPAGTYTITVKASASGHQAQTTTVTLTVK